MYKDLVAHVNLGEAERAEVGIGSFDGWLDGLTEEFVNKLANIWPHLLNCLWEINEKEAERERRKMGQYLSIYPHRI